MREVLSVARLRVSKRGVIEGPTLGLASMGSTVSKLYRTVSTMEDHPCPVSINVCSYCVEARRCALRVLRSAAFDDHPRNPLSLLHKADDGVIRSMRSMTGRMSEAIVQACNRARRLFCVRRPILRSLSRHAYMAKMLTQSLMQMQNATFKYLQDTQLTRHPTSLFLALSISAVSQYNTPKSARLNVKASVLSIEKLALSNIAC